MPQAIPAIAALALHAVEGVAWVNKLAQALTVVAASQAVDAVVKNNSKPREQGGLINLELNPSPPRRLVIGKRAVGGTLVDWYLGSTNNTKLYLPIYISEGPCGTITKVWAGGRVVWSTPLVHGVRTAIPDFRSGGDRVWLTYYDGRVGQTADATLVALGQGWTSANKMTGCAYVVVELQWDSDNLRTPPAFVFEHEGAKLYDRRKDSTAGGSGLHRLTDPSTWELGDSEGANPMVSLDHFQLGRFWNGQRVFGIGMPSKFVPYDKFAAQANVCDENVAKKAGGTQKRYRANGVITANEAWDEIVKRHCTAMCAQPADFGGRVGVIGIEARTPVMDISDDEVVDMASEVYIPKRTFGNLVGVVRGKYQEPEQVYQPVPYAEVNDPAWDTQDAAEPREFNFDLDFETNSERAERLATLKAKYERRQATLTGVYPYNTIELERGDWFVRSGAAGSRFGVTGKTFEVMERIFDPETFTVTINAQEVDPADSAWNESLAADPPPAPLSSTAALSAIQVPAITVTAISLTGTLSSVPALRVAWTAPTDPRVRFLYVEVENTDGTTPKTAKTVAIPSDANFIVISEGVADGEEYGVSAKFLSDTLQSEWCIAAIVFSSGAFATGAASSVPWSGVTGAGKPEDNATVGGTFGVNIRETAGGATALLSAFKTILGQAATITSQGAFATVNTAAYGSGLLTGFGSLAALAFTTFGTNVRRADGTTIVTDALAITSLGQAATIAGQGALATLAQVNLGVSGRVYRDDGVTRLTDAIAVTSLGQAATIASQGALATLGQVNLGVSGRVYRDDGTTRLTDAIAVTSLGQAATIAGQGAFATISSAAYGSGLLTGFGSLAALAFTTFGTNVRRADGTTIVTDALAITSLGQAATIAGQGSLATQNLVSSALLAAGVGKNAMYDTRFALDFANNFRGTAQSGTPTFTTATSASGVEYLQLTGAGVTVGNIITIDDYPRRALFPVKAGEIVEAHGLIGGANCSAFFARITWRDAASVFLSVSTGSSVASPGAGGGDVSTYTKVGVIAAAPANAVYAQVEFIGTASTAAPQIRVARPFKTLAKAGQTEFSEWGPGIEAEVGADVTSANQAATITGQGALATLGQVNLGASGRVYRDDGTTRLTDALAVTSLGQAATIAGQGAFATVSSVANGSAFLTGFGGLSSLAFTTLGTNVRQSNQITIVTDATAITSLGQAATISGQGTGATANNLAGLNATDNANLNSALAGIRRIGDVSNFANDGLHWTTTFGGTPDAAADPVADGYFDVPDIGRVIRLSATAYLTKKSVFKPIEGRRYLQIVRLRAHTNPSSGVMTAALSNINGLDINYAHGPGVASATITPPNAIFQKASFVTADGWITLARVWVAGAASTYNAYWRLRLDITQTGAGGKVEVAAFDVLDVTDMPVGRSLADLFRADGTTALTDATVVTSLGQAATISGQGALATLNQTNLGASGRVYRDDGVTRLTDALAVTSLGQAATIAGQGALATKATIDSTALMGSQVVSYTALTTTAVRLGTNITRADGTTSVTDATAITSLGQAATIAGQGSFATLSSASRTGGLLTDFGSLAGLSNALGLQAGSITGQGWGATASEANASNAQIPLGENLLVNTDWQEGIDGWAQGWTGDSGLGVTQGMALSGWTGFVRTSYVTIAGTPAINTVADSLTQKTYANLADLRRYSPRVRVGDRLWVGSYAAGHRCRCVVIVCWFDENGAIISSIEVGRTTSDNTPGGFANGRLENAERIGSFITVPASTCYMQIIHRLVSVGGVADPYAFFGFPMVAKVSSVQTVAPAYVTGKADRYVDYTPENQAASFSGQAALATLSFVQLSSNVRLADGTTIATNALLVTSQGQAATIAGQGALATKNQAAADDINVSSLSAISANLGNITSGAIDLTANNYVVRHGAGFGASSDLVMWYGLASIARSSATKTNGVFTLATDGKVYFGASELTSSSPLNATMTEDYLAYHNTTINPTLDNLTASVSSITNGTAPYSYLWAFEVLEEGVGEPTLSGTTTSTCTINKSGALGANQSYIGFVSCTITDANNKQVTKYFKFSRISNSQ